MEVPAVRMESATGLPDASSPARKRAVCAGRYQPCPISSSRAQDSFTGLPNARATVTAEGTMSSRRRRP